jgi:hypothetical protein
MIQRLLTRVAVIGAFALSAHSAAAQNVMHLRIDTVTAKPGAMVDVRVLYTFTSTHAHDIHDYNARFLFDTSKSKLVAYVLSGSASVALSAPNDTIGSHAGMLLIGNGQEIDLTDSVLFTIRMTLDSNADTAWIRWDSSWYHSDGLAVFTAGDEGIDSVIQEDGWIRTSEPPASVESVSSVQAPFGMYPNPAREDVKIDLPGSSGNAVMKVYDAVGRLSFEGPLVLGGWQIPSGFPAGAYEVLLNETGRTVQNIGTLIVSPR